MRIIRQPEGREPHASVAECSRCHSLFELDASEYQAAVRSATYCANCGWHITADDLRVVQHA
jgi:hypothetical protein